MSKYEISSLYRTVRPRFMLYSPDGNGRDTYISYNNGGFWNKGISPKNERATSLEHGHKYVTRSHGMHVAPFKYYSDGLGRDSYILYQSGGLKRDSKALNEFHLKDFLRTPESCIFEFKKNQTKDGRIANTHYISQKQKEMNDYLSKNQRGVIQRLYDNERHKFIKK